MERGPLRVGLIGFGAIGQAVTRLAAEHYAGELTLVAALVRDPARVRSFAGPPLVITLDALVAAGPEVVVEVGGHDALREHGPGVLRAGRDLVLVSVGAFAVPDVLDTCLAAARAGGGQMKVASGAIGALDAIAAAAVGGLDRVTHTTRKPAHTLLPPDEAAALTEAREVFRGSAREGALRFPESINVAAAVSLAGIGLDHTEVVVLADPQIARNMHTVVATGAFGTLRFEIEGIPTEANPRTGRLVAMSVVRTLYCAAPPCCRLSHAHSAPVSRWQTSVDEGGQPRIMPILPRFGPILVDRQCQAAQRTHDTASGSPPNSGGEMHATLLSSFFHRFVIL